MSASSATKSRKDSDISQLDHVDEESVLAALRARYDEGCIYTDCGDVLIAINPYRPLPLYEKTHHESYDWKLFQVDAEPHIFKVACRAYRRMRETTSNQVIVVSGESGAGKTESAKYILKHLVSMSHQGSTEVHEKIIHIIPLMEAFGNARSITNDNSSRFANYLELSFNKDGQILGATVRDYMLEKSRVVSPPEDEGNFHIFYALFAGASEQQLQLLRLGKAEGYKLTNDPDSLRQIQQYSDMYTRQIRVLQNIGITGEEIANIHLALAAIVHLTDVSVVESGDKSGGVDLKDATPLLTAAELLSIDFQQLGHALISTTTQIAGHTAGQGRSLVRWKSVGQTEEGRDALAKAIYERLFGWLVRKINEGLHPNRRGGETAAACIAMLDMEGFEVLILYNNFEQLSINIMNEKLQNFTNNTFKQEKMVYREEGVSVAAADIPNNDGVVDLLFKPRVGLLALLDEETRLLQGTYTTFVQKLTSIHKASEVFTECTAQRAEFGIRHSAGEVWYDATQFLEKNRDAITPELLSCLQNSQNEFFSDLFTVKRGPTGTISVTPYNYRHPLKPKPGGGLKTLAIDLRATLAQQCGKVDSAPDLTYLTIPKDHKTVVSYFQASLNDLISKLRVADPLFVRCIKPNSSNEPGDYKNVKVKRQVQYSGLVEIARLRSRGYPVRRTYLDFLTRYCCLCPEAKQITKPQDAAKCIFQAVLPSHMQRDFRLGDTKVFMKEAVYITMEKEFDKYQESTEQ